MNLPQKIVMASGNAGKIREIRRLLAHVDTEILSQSDFGVPEVDESGATFEENALIKARHAVIATGLPAIADDSGLVVDALDGAPGVHSARYAGAGASDDDNIDKLLAALDGVPAADRGATFHCTACYLETADAEPIFASGTWRGRILESRRGDRGFGYDPVFEDIDSGRAAAELDAEQKNARSHRGQALRRLTRRLGAV